MLVEEYNLPSKAVRLMPLAFSPINMNLNFHKIIIMHRIPTFLTLLVFSVITSLSASSCRKDQAQPACDTSYLPVVFVHGFLASGDTYADQVARFSSNNYCDDRLHAFDWNTLAGAAAAIPQLDAFIDRILAATGAPKVNLVGHSAGGGLGYTYLSDAARAAKVAHYAHLGSGPQSKAAGPDGEIPTLNLYSADDRVVTGGDIPGATNKQFTGLDHYEIATAAEVFAEMFAFFNSGKAPRTTAKEVQDEIMLSGRVVTLGENAPQAGATIEIYELNSADGMRRFVQPDAILTAGADGSWGPWKAKTGARYEFFVRTTTADDRPIHYYRESFTRSNPLVYLRTFPGPGSLAGLLLAGVPRNDDQSVLAVFSASRAVMHQRDMLSADGYALSTEQLTPASKTIIAMFLYDNGNQQTSGAVHPTFALMQSFLTGIDYYIPTSAPASVHLQFNGRSLYVPNWKSASEGVSVAVFD